MRTTQAVIAEQPVEQKPRVAEASPPPAVSSELIALLFLTYCGDGHRVYISFNRARLQMSLQGVQLAVGLVGRCRCPPRRRLVATAEMPRLEYVADSEQF